MGILHYYVIDDFFFTDLITCKFHTYYLSLNMKALRFPITNIRRWMSTCKSSHLPTVYALSSGHGKCGVAVIRVTGTKTADVFNTMIHKQKIPKPRQAVLNYICHPVSGEFIDKGLLLWFPEPRSFTGENMLELQVHGGPAVIKAILSALGTLEGFSPAQAGDFTKRAFYNSKIDLISTEGLGDLIHAESEMQRKQAFRQMEGSLSSVYSHWRQILIECRGTVEAFIDFGEDQNIEDHVLKSVKIKLGDLLTSMQKHLSDSRRGERLRDGLKVTILGRPNVGKSSFLNQVVQKPAAIVTPIAGTTRDIVEIPFDLGGYPLLVSDTAGLRETEDPIEKEGVIRALSKAEHCDLALIMVDANEMLSYLRQAATPKDFLHQYLQDLRMSLSDEANHIIFINKIDLVGAADKEKINQFLGSSGNCLSLLTNEGLDRAMDCLKDKCALLCSTSEIGESAYLTSARHRTHISACVKELHEIMFPLERYEGIDCLLTHDSTVEFAAQNLRLATDELECVIGQITTEDILDYIFSSFCIGK